MVYHAHIGDVGPLGSVDSTSVSCFCACQRCMAGTCCQWPNPTIGYVPPFTTTTTTSTPFLPVSVHEHDYAKLTAKRLFCRKCGETKEV